MKFNDYKQTFHVVVEIYGATITTTTSDIAASDIATTPKVLIYHPQNLTMNWCPICNKSLKQKHCEFCNVDF